ncbi:MAG: hypothetical protein Q8P05_01430 [Candidatus Diapherotrites archaeon]|nr:hypothetical protein [Candidatus Diapherotrites archaeon]
MATLVKDILIFCLEDILIPGKINPNLKIEGTKALLDGMKTFGKSHPELRIFLISTLQKEVFDTKMKDFSLFSYFDPSMVFAVDEAYIASKSPEDKILYDQRCGEDPYCKDEYFRQVQMQAILEKKGATPEKALLIGHDYWFDGFYTRRFSKVDMAFMTDALSSRDKPIAEKIEGLWYVSRDWNSIQRLLEGKESPPNYNFLDTFVTTTIAEELLGGKGFPLIKKVVLERQRERSGVS